MLIMNNGSNFLFVGGVPRSGTSIFQKILDGHSDIYAGPEFDHINPTMNLMNNFLKGISSKRQMTFYCENEVLSEFNHLLTNFFVRTIQKKNVRFFSEKTPNNVLVFNDLNRIYPEAKFIWVIRHPMACLSSFRSVAAKNKNSNLGNNIFSDAALIKEYLGAGERFYNAHPDKCHKIYFEDLMLNPVESIKNVCDFIGVNFEYDMLDTTKPSDIKLIHKKGADGLEGFFSEGLKDKPLDLSIVDKWKTKLNIYSQTILESLLSDSNLECLERYFLKNKLSTYQKLYPYYKEFGLQWYIKKILKF